MKIVIETNGRFDGTKIYFNDRLIGDISEFQFSVRENKNCKAQIKRKIKESEGNVTPEFLSYYGNDFVKMDELNEEKE